MRYGGAPISESVKQGVESNGVERIRVEVRESGWTRGRGGVEEEGKATCEFPRKYRRPAVAR